MKSVLISIQPRWCELIANGKKTVEVRKTKPKIDVPFKCYIYETKGKKKYFSQPMPIPYNEGKGKVIGEFVCDNIAKGNSQLGSCLTMPEISEYANRKAVYGWHISNLVIYDKPKELSEFVNYDRCPYGGLVDCQKCGEHHCLTRPPQSWCYVEEEGAK